MVTENGGIPGIQRTGKGRKPREAYGTLHVSKLEVVVGNPTGGTETDT